MPVPTANDNVVIDGTVYHNYAVNIIDEHIAARKMQLEDPRVVNQDLIIQIKISLEGMQNQKRALVWAMELPKSIKETGKIARELNDKLPV